MREFTFDLAKFIPYRDKKICERGVKQCYLKRKAKYKN